MHHKKETFVDYNQAKNKNITNEIKQEKTNHSK